MPVKLVYSPRALADLDDAWSFLADDCDNPQAADKAISTILASLERLSELPESGTPLDARCIVHSNYRFVTTGTHLAFYRFEETTVYIDRILDSRSDYLRTLFGTPGSAIDMYA